MSYLELGARKGGSTEAALHAGYGSGSNRKAAKARASELLRNPKVLAALRDELSKRFSAAAVVGADILIELALTARSEQVRLSAARELVDRGYGPVVSRSAAVPVKTKPSLEEFLASLDAPPNEHVVTTE